MDGILRLKGRMVARLAECWAAVQADGAGADPRGPARRALDAAMDDLSQVGRGGGGGAIGWRFECELFAGPSRGLVGRWQLGGW